MFVEIQFLDIPKNKEYYNLIEQVLNQCFIDENIDNLSMYISVTLTDNENIQKINKQHRNTDKPTDVLSFPMFEKEELENLIKKSKKAFKSSKTNDIIKENILGDIIISIEKIKEQAKEYGHSIKRELAYMLVHGFYHLNGYDHIEEKEQQLMRQKEENILNKLNILR